MDEIPFDMFTFLGSTRLQCFETHLYFKKIV